MTKNPVRITCFRTTRIWRDVIYVEHASGTTGIDCVGKCGERMWRNGRGKGKCSTRNNIKRIKRIPQAYESQASGYVEHQKACGKEKNCHQTRRRMSGECGEKRKENQRLKMSKGSNSKERHPGKWKKWRRERKSPMRSIKGEALLQGNNCFSGKNVSRVATRSKIA